MLGGLKPSKLDQPGLVSGRWLVVGAARGRAGVERRDLRAKPEVIGGVPRDRAEHQPEPRPEVIGGFPRDRAEALEHLRESAK